MPVYYSPGEHTAEVLSQELLALPPDMIVVGSIGRALLMGGDFGDLRRHNGQARDIDVIDTSGSEPTMHAQQSGAFALDTLMTRHFRPIEGGYSWGLFLQGNVLFGEVDGEFMVPRQVRIPGDEQGRTTNVAAAPVQAELATITGIRRPHQQSIDRFVDFAQTERLPDDVQRIFREYRSLYRDQYLHGSPEEDVTLSERIYRRMRLTYKQSCPTRIQAAVDLSLGPVVRRMRGTPLVIATHG